jgi:hypothetical protein
MSTPLQRGATALWLVGLALAIVMALGWIEVFTHIDDEDMTAPLFIALVSVMITYGILGRVLVAQRPYGAVGWIFLAVSLLFGITFFGYSMVGWGEVAGYGLDLAVERLFGPLAPVAETLAPAAFLPALLGAVPVLALVFPDGHLPGPRWRWPAAVLGALTLVVTLATLFGSSADALLGPTIALGVVLGIASVIVRIRRGTPLERRQLAWFLAATAVSGTLMSTIIFGGPETSVVDIVAIASLGLLPLATTIAVLRYRLYEIDRIVSRTIAYVVITAILVGVFASAVLASQALLASVTGGDTIPVALSTLLVFALFQPVRRRVQAVVDRRFNRRRVDAQRSIDRYGRRLRDEVDLATVRDETLATVAHVVEPRTATLWVREVAVR